MKTGMELILGDTGAGKSSFMYANLITEMFDKDRYRLAKGITKALISGGYLHLSLPPKHLCYSEYFVQSHVIGKPKYVTWQCCAKKFGIPNDEKEMDFYPPCSVIALDEIQGKFENRNWKNLKDYYKRGWEINRHMLYHIMLVSQFGNVDKDMRNLVVGVYYIEKKWQEWSKGKYPYLQSFWQYKHFDDWASFEDWYSNREKKKVKDEIFKFDGDIRKCYDGEVYRALWLKGRKDSNYSQTQNVPVVPTVESYDNFISVVGENDD